MSGLGPLTVRELKKWYRNPVFFITGLLQPFFWIALFGSAFDITKFFPGASELILDGAPNYITYIVGGVLTISSLFTAMFAGTNIIFDRRLGPMGRFLSSPIRRSSIVFSKILSSTIRVMPQALILILAALVIPNGLKFVHGFSSRRPRYYCSHNPCIIHLLIHIQCYCYQNDQHEFNIWNSKSCKLTTLVC